MWSIIVPASLLPPIIIVILSSRCRLKVVSLCQRVLSWMLRLVREGPCVRSMHDYVFSNCTHGNAVSVLETFDLYAEIHPSVCIFPQIGEVLDELVGRIRPLRVLLLGMRCGYSSVRMLRLLPPGGKMIIVDVDPVTAELAEEIILVAGFKHPQFQILTCSSPEAITCLYSYLEPDQGITDGFSLVLMDHNPQQYLPDLLTLETEKLLCPSGCSVVIIERNQSTNDLREALDHIRTRSDCYRVMKELPCMTEIFYQKESTLFEDGSTS